MQPGRRAIGARATFEILQTDPWGKWQTHGPFDHCVRVGTDFSCQVQPSVRTAVYPSHAEICPSPTPGVYLLRCLDPGAYVAVLHGRGHPHQVYTATQIRDGQSFCVGHPNQPVVLTLREVQHAAQPSPAPPPREQSPPSKDTLYRLAWGGVLLLGLVLFSVGGFLAANRDRRQATVYRIDTTQPSPPQAPPEKKESSGGTPPEPLLDRNYTENPTGKADLEMDRFAKISGNNNYRSARIHSKEQLAFVVEKYNLRHVVNLALDSMTKQQDRGLGCAGMSKPCEPNWAEAIGVEFHRHYLTNKPPSEKDWEQVRQLLEEGDVLLHCTHGVDRTGAVVARWERSQHPQLTDEELQEYTYAFGGQWKLPGRPNRHLEKWMLEEP